LPRCPAGTRRVAGCRAAAGFVANRSFCGGRLREAKIQVAIASSAKRDELSKYLEIAGISRLGSYGLVDDAEESKPVPDIFEVVLEKPKLEGKDGSRQRHFLATDRYTVASPTAGPSATSRVPQCERLRVDCQCDVNHLEALPRAALSPSM
jgi:hypothetical protein